MLVGIDGTGLVCLGSSHHDTVSTLFHDAQKEICIFLLAGRETPVPFGISHSTIHHQIIFLHIGQVFDEICVILGAILLVDFVCSGEHRIESVHPHAALEAGSGLLSQQSLHLDLFPQVVRTLMKMGEPVDFLASEIGGCGHQILVLRIMSQFIGHGKTVDGWFDHGMIHPVVDFFAEHVHSGVELSQAFNILVSCHQSHPSSPLLFHPGHVD